MNCWLKGHMHARLGCHPKALDLCLKIVHATIDFWDSFVPLLTGFYSKLLATVYEGGKCSNALKSACWGVATGTFHVMLKEVCKVRVQATNAYLLFVVQAMGLFIHATLQEPKILKEFKEALIKHHPLIHSSMVTHLFNTHIPKTKLNLTKSSMASLKIKCNQLNRLVAAQRKLIDANPTAIGNLKQKTKK